MYLEYLCARLHWRLQKWSRVTTPQRGLGFYSASADMHSFLKTKNGRCALVLVRRIFNRIDDFNVSKIIHAVLKADAKNTGNDKATGPSTDVATKQ